MRFKLILLLLVVFLSVENGQPQSNEQVSLQIRTTTVWLGMPKDEVMKRFADAGAEIIDQNNAVIAKFSDDVRTLLFKNGLLSFADVVWPTESGSEGEAVLGALSALTENANKRPCIVDHNPLSYPTESINRIFVTCGPRSVLISQGTIQGNPFFEVSERIGEAPGQDPKEKLVRTPRRTE